MISFNKVRLKIWYQEAIIRVTHCPCCLVAHCSLFTVSSGTLALFTVSSGTLALCLVAHWHCSLCLVAHCTGTVSSGTVALFTVSRKTVL